MFKKKVVKSGETKTLLYQLSWIKFVMTFETKAVTHGKYNNDKCQKNLHILKLIIEAVMLFRNKGLHSEATENNQITAKAITKKE